jgi:hypothetical protein
MIMKTECRDQDECALVFQTENWTLIEVTYTRQRRNDDTQNRSVSTSSPENNMRVFCILDAVFLMYECPADLIVAFAAQTMKVWKIAMIWKNFYERVKPRTAYYGKN